MRRFPAFLLVLIALAFVPLSCSDLSVDPAEEDLTASPAPTSARASAALPFDIGLDEAQKQMLFRVLAGVTEPERIATEDHQAMVQQLSDARAQIIAVHEEKVFELQQSDLTPEEQAQQAQAQEALRDFALSFMDKSLAALARDASATVAPTLPLPRIAPEALAPMEHRAAAPTIFCVQPPNGRVGELVLIFGTNFDFGAIPFFGSVPSIPLFTLSSPFNVPFFGRLSVMITPVPPNIFQGNTPLTIEFNGERSEPTPFRVRLFGDTYDQGPDPELWCSNPQEGGFLQPVLLLGFDFDEDSDPFFGSIPALNLGTFTLPFEIPFFGTFSGMLTLNPRLFPGDVGITVRRDGDQTESVPFEVR